jgi:hypothetical protein
VGPNRVSREKTALNPRRKKGRTGGTKERVRKDRASGERQAGNSEKGREEGDGRLSGWGRRKGREYAPFGRWEPAQRAGGTLLRAGSGSLDDTHSARRAKVETDQRKGESSPKEGRNKRTGVSRSCGEVKKTCGRKRKSFGGVSGVLWGVSEPRLAQL